MIPVTRLSLENKGDGPTSMFSESGDGYKHHFCCKMRSYMVTSPPLLMVSFRNIMFPQWVHTALTCFHP
jgi:hypothetical protein